MCTGVAGGSSAEALFLVFLLPTLCHLSLWDSAGGSVMSLRAMPGFTVSRQDPSWPWWAEALTSLLPGSIFCAPSLIKLCLVPHRALLKKLGGLFLPPEANLTLDSSEGVLARAVVHAVSAPSGTNGVRPGACCCSGLDTSLSQPPSRLWSSCW